MGRSLARLTSLALLGGIGAGAGSITTAYAHLLPYRLAVSYIYNRGLDLRDAYAWNHPGSSPRFRIDGCKRYDRHRVFCVTTLFHNDPAGAYHDCWYTINAYIRPGSSRVRTSVYKESCG